jgi:hypothetical protein
MRRVTLFRARSGARIKSRLRASIIICSVLMTVLVPANTQADPPATADRPPVSAPTAPPVSPASPDPVLPSNPAPTPSIDLTPNKTAYVIWTITSLALIISTAIILVGERMSFSRTRESIQSQYKKTFSQIETDVVRYIETSIVFKESRHEMRAFLLPKLEEFAASADKRISILGADPLRPSMKKFNDLQENSISNKLADPERDGMEFSYGKIFNTILLRTSDKHLTRYIYLFRPQDLQGRTPNFRADYLAWLEDQAAFFRINENYTIVDTPRATVWGAPKSIIFFRNNMAEVFFKEGGVILTSRSDSSTPFVSAAHKSLIDDYVNVKAEGLVRNEYTHLTLPAFEEYIDSIRTEVELGARQAAIVFTETRHTMRQLLLPKLENFSGSRDKEIVILGADQLRPSVARFAKLEEKSATNRFSNPEERIEFQYGSMFNSILASSSDKVLRRFIYLFRPEDLEGRTKELRDAYLAWLVDQAKFFGQNKAYTIIDTPRATVWGAPKSIIFFRNNMAEVFFRGGGIVVTSPLDSDDSLVASTKKLLIDDYVGSTEGAPARNEYNQNNINEFELYIERVRAEVTRKDKR